MYIDNGLTYYRGSEQCTARARFLLLVQSEERKTGPGNFRAIVRKVALRQCGHYMMGTARIAGESIAVSGAYGADGLPKTVPEKVYQQGVPVPRELYDAWNHGGGWNGAGSEAPAMREWARKTFTR